MEATERTALERIIHAGSLRVSGMGNIYEDYDWPISVFALPRQGRPARPLSAGFLKMMQEFEDDRMLEGRDYPPGGGDWLSQSG